LPVRTFRLLTAALIALSSTGAEAGEVKVLRVCADPNNLPFSASDGSGFENELAQLVARDLHARVEYTWWAQRRGALRNTLKARACDVVMGVPTSMESVATTKSYYRSSYVFVSKAERGLDISTFDDPRLRSLRLGVQVVGDDYTNTPPVHALSARGISDNVRGYSVLGDYAEPVPAARIIDAVKSGEVDLAIVWGPLAGYFTRGDGHGLSLRPTPAQDGAWPMRFDIGMGVRREDRELRQRLDRFLVRHRAVVDALLTRYGVPRP
jgi:mxaJ protein